MTATLTDPKQLIDQALSRLTGLATLPEITSQIIATVEDPRSSATQLHKIIAHDPALVSRILKVVNSSFFGVATQINSVDRAIVMLGLNSVKNIALAAGVGSMFRGAKLCDGYTPKDLWKHCVAVAVVARELAKRSGSQHAEEAFLAGMVHDLGLLASLQSWPEKLRQVCAESQNSAVPFIEIERRIVGVDHQQLGEALAARWKFPQACRAVAGCHHEAISSEAPFAMLIALINIADTICCQTKQGFPLTAALQQITDAQLAVAEVSRETVDAVITDISSLVSVASTLLGN